MSAWKRSSRPAVATSSASRSRGRARRNRLWCAATKTYINSAVPSFGGGCVHGPKVGAGAPRGPHLARSDAACALCRDRARAGVRRRWRAPVALHYQPTRDRRGSGAQFRRCHLRCLWRRAARCCRSRRADGIRLPQDLRAIGPGCGTLPLGRGRARGHGVARRSRHLAPRAGGPPNTLLSRRGTLRRAVCRPSASSSTAPSSWHPLSTCVDASSTWCRVATPSPPTVWWRSS